jgi:signal transduction histidine kinase
MSSLISHLLSFARADKDSADFCKETVNLSELAHSVAGQTAEIATEKQITVTTDIKDGLTVSGDETLLIRMMWNLLENSVKYGKQGGVTSFALQGENGTVVGEITDDGCGIAEEHIEKIWERFYQVNESRSGGGFGLGLSMVRYIVETHGGNVSATSAPGSGSIFTFRLPLKDS